MKKWRSLAFTRKTFDYFFDFVSECVSFQRKLNNPFWVSPFFEEKWWFSLDVKQNIHFTDEKQRKTSLRSAPLTIVTLLEKFTIQHTNNNHNHNNNNNPIWWGSVLTGEEVPHHPGELNHALSQEGVPSWHISMEHRLRRKHQQLNSDTIVGNEIHLKEKNEWKTNENWRKWKLWSAGNGPFVTPPFLSTKAKNRIFTGKSSFPQQKPFDVFFFVFCRKKSNKE